MCYIIFMRHSAVLERLRKGSFVNVSAGQAAIILKVAQYLAKHSLATIHELVNEAEK